MTADEKQTVMAVVRKKNECTHVFQNMTAAVRREKNLQVADNLIWQPLVNHPWTVDPWCTRYDEVVVRRDVTDSLLRTCVHNKLVLLGRVKFPTTATDFFIPILLPWTAFDRPCTVIIETTDGGKYSTRNPAEYWALRHTVQGCRSLTLRRDGKLESPFLQLDFEAMTWHQRNAGLLTSSLSLSAGSSLADSLSLSAVSVYEIPTDDGRCLLRLLTIPALVRLAVLTSSDNNNLLSSLATAVKEYFYGCRLGSRRPDWLPVKTWTAWRRRVIDKGAMPTVDSLPPELVGTMYESLALASAAAMFADATAMPLAHRLLPKYPDVDAAMTKLQTHVAGSDNARHRYAMADSLVWVPVADAVKTVIHDRLAEAISQCSGGDIWERVISPPPPLSPKPQGLKKRRHVDKMDTVSAPLPARLLYDTWQATDPWMAGTHSAESTWRWHHEAITNLTALPFAETTPVLAYFNFITAEIRDSAPEGIAALPSAWEFVGKGIPGSPVWVRHVLTGAVSAFFWDCRCVLVDNAAYRLAHALDHPSAAVPFPWMVIEAGAAPPQKPGFGDFCRMNADLIARRTCGVSMYHTLEVVDGAWQETSLLTGASKYVDSPVAFFPAEVAFPSLPYSNFRPYSLLLETMHPDSCRFYLVQEDAVPVKTMAAAVYRQLLATAVHNGRCNVACDRVSPREDAHTLYAWSAQPAVVHVTFSGNVVTFAVEDILPVLRPFVAVSTPTGEVVQIVDERAVPTSASAILYRRPGYCQVPYCHLPGKMYGLMLCPYHADQACSSFGIGP